MPARPHESGEDFIRYGAAEPPRPMTDSIGPSQYMQLELVQRQAGLSTAAAQHAQRIAGSSARTTSLLWLTLPAVR